MLTSQIALTTFYGISYDTALRICARIGVHERATVMSLTEAQVTELSAYLSSPGLIPARGASPTRAAVDAPPAQAPQTKQTLMAKRQHQQHQHECSA